MIEPVEQALLLDLAEFLQLAPADTVCEFGCYFGRSTRCLADGLMKNAAFVSCRPAIHAYDVFSCARRGLLADFVLDDAARAGVAHLLRQDAERIDFMPVFDHFTAHLPAGLVQRRQTELADARHAGGPIALMHVDAPKWYAEYRQLLREFGPHLKPGCQIVFQDYFYQWSAGLIGAIQLLVEAGEFEPLESAASSLLVRARGPLTPVMLSAVESQFEATETSVLIGRALEGFQGFELDRPELFVPRLHLAAMQSEFERGRPKEGAVWFKNLVQYAAGTLKMQTLADLADLLRHGFSLRALYEADTVS